jgi:lipopolysaccharide export system permease protein
MAAAFIQDGVFEDLRKGLTLYVRERDSDGVLHGILLHDTRDPQSPVTILAERATLLQDDTGSEAVLFDGTRQELNAADGRMTSLTFDRYTFDLRRVEQPTQRPWRNLKERYLHELLTPGPSKAEQRLRNELIAEGHQRLILPLYVIAFVAVGLGALLSGEFDRRGQAWRVALAIGLVAFLEGLQLALRDFAGREPAGIFAMYAAVILSTVAAFYIFLQGHRQTFSLPRWRKAAVP